MTCKTGHMSVLASVLASVRCQHFQNSKAPSRG